MKELEATATEGVSWHDRALAAEAKLARSREQTRELNRVGVALSAEHDTDKLLGLILRTLRQWTVSDAGSIFLVERAPDGERVLRFKLLENDSTTAQPPAQLVLPIDDSTLAGWVAHTGAPLRIPDAYEIPETAPYGFNRALDEQLGYRTRSILVLPLRGSDGQTVGVIQLINRKRKAEARLDLTNTDAEVLAFEDAAVDLAMSLTSQAAVSLANDLLYESLERKVAERTRALEQAMAELVEKEKFASLGQLVAGIAHEINNPLAFARNNVHLGRLRAASAARRAAVEQWRGAETAARAEAAGALLERLESDADLAGDVRDVRAEAGGLDGPARLALVDRFCEYVLERRNAEDGAMAEALAGVDELLSQATVGMDRVAQIVLGLRNFSRLDEAAFQDADIDEGVRNTLMLLQHAAKEKDVRVAAELGLTRKYACFPAKLNQVVLNLVTNAIDASDRAGEVIVRTAEVGGEVEIAVVDGGPGISDEHLGKLFVPFFTTKQIGKGTGLGLAISYGIVKEHGGTIAARRNEGRGTTFVVRIPKAQ